MMLNIKTGYGGITQFPNSEIVVFASSLRRLESMGHAFVFTDRHALLANARFYRQLSDLKALDWAIWQARDFRRDPDDPEKLERYQAEALVRGLLPTEALLGLVCYNSQSERELTSQVTERGMALGVHARPGWYF